MSLMQFDRWGDQETTNTNTTTSEEIQSFGSK